MSHAKPDREKVQKFNTLVAPYLGADTRRSVRQLLTSVIPFVALWYLSYRALDVGYWLTLLLAVPTAGFLMRMFMIQHDCGHGSFFKSRRARDWVGFWIGVCTLIPYQYWRKTHAYHHAHAGDLDFRGFGDVDTLTLQEYRALPPLKRFAYRAYRHPLVLFGIGPLFHFVVKHRYPWDIPRDWRQAWRSVWLTNLGIAGIAAAVIAVVGWKAFVLVHLPVMAVTTSAGVWLFYVQHQFEDTYWHRHEDWDYFDAALQGSSYLVLPRPLQWITANIGIHHVHHLNARIPNYRLQECMEANPEFQEVTRITVRESWRLTRLALWDEEAQELISFREARRRLPSAA
ncbi:MAG TPA: fatty acid desaturase [Longimicrobiales bacterium]|nr:fatty acid desaturase [Longimicrobiales bacterium]